MSPTLLLALMLFAPDRLSVRQRVAAGLAAAFMIATQLSSVALAAGLHVSRIDGSPVVYNDPDPWLPDFLVCRAPFAEPVLKAIDAAWREWQRSRGE